MLRAGGGGRTGGLGRSQLRVPGSFLAVVMMVAHLCQLLYNKTTFNGCIAWCVNYISIKLLKIIEALKKTFRKFRSSYEGRNKSPSSSRKETKVFMK